MGVEFSFILFTAVFTVEEEPLNQLHGSDSKDSAGRELELLFPVEQTLAAIKPDAFERRGTFCSVRFGSVRVSELLTCVRCVVKRWRENERRTVARRM